MCWCRALLYHRLLEFSFDVKMVLSRPNYWIDDLVLLKKSLVNNITSPRPEDMQREWNHRNVTANKTAERQ